MVAQHPFNRREHAKVKPFLDGSAPDFFQKSCPTRGTIARRNYESVGKGTLLPPSGWFEGLDRGSHATERT